MRKVYSKNITNKKMLSIKEGGTSSNTESSATAKLNVLSTDLLNQPKGLLGLDSQGKILPYEVPVAFYDPFDKLNDGNITGPVVVRYGDVHTFTISDYDENAAYTVKADIGVALRIPNTDKITYSWPSIVLKMDKVPIIGFYINDRFIKLSPITNQISTPKLLTPLITNPVLNVNDLNITSSVFSMVNGNSVHKSTDYEIYSDANLNDLLLSSYNDKDLTKKSFQFDKTNLTELHIRIRYNGDNANVYSEWSKPYKINLFSIRVNKPTLIGNANQNFDIDSDRINSSSFISDYSDCSHSETEYEIYSVDNPITPIFTEKETVNKTSHGFIASLQNNYTFLIRFRYKTNYNNIISPWSDIYSFKTKDISPDNPIITNPINLSHDNYIKNLVIRASLHSSLTDSRYHSETDWELSSVKSFSDIIFSSYNDNKNLLSITVNELLKSNIQYFIRCRFKNSLTSTFSSWSPVCSFFTENLVINKPFILDPTDYDIYEAIDSIVVKSSNFSMKEGNEKHLYTEWELRKLDGALVNSGVNQTDIKNVTTINIPQEIGTYSIRLRYISDVSNSVSEWSNEVHYILKAKKIYEKIIVNGFTNDVVISDDIKIKITGGVPNTEYVLSVEDEKGTMILLTDLAKTFTYVLNDKGESQFDIVIPSFRVEVGIVNIKIAFKGSNNFTTTKVTFSYPTKLLLCRLSDNIKTTGSDVTVTLVNGKPSGKIEFYYPSNSGVLIKEDYTLDKNGELIDFFKIKYSDIKTIPHIVNFKTLYDNRILYGYISTEVLPAFNSGLNIAINNSYIDTNVVDSQIFDLRVVGGDRDYSNETVIFANIEPYVNSELIRKAGFYDLPGRVSYSGLVTDLKNTTNVNGSIFSYSTKKDVYGNMIPVQNSFVYKKINILTKTTNSGTGGTGTGGGSTGTGNTGGGSGSTGGGGNTGGSGSGGSSTGTGGSSGGNNSTGTGNTGTGTGSTGSSGDTGGTTLPVNSGGTVISNYPIYVNTFYSSSKGYYEYIKVPLSTDVATTNTLFIKDTYINLCFDNFMKDARYPDLVIKPFYAYGNLAGLEGPFEMNEEGIKTGPPAMSRIISFYRDKLYTEPFLLNIKSKDGAVDGHVKIKIILDNDTVNTPIESLKYGGILYDDRTFTRPIGYDEYGTPSKGYCCLELLTTDGNIWRLPEGETYEISADIKLLRLRVSEYDYISGPVGVSVKFATIDHNFYDFTNQTKNPTANNAGGYGLYSGSAPASYGSWSYGYLKIDTLLKTNVSYRAQIEFEITGSITRKVIFYAHNDALLPRNRTNLDARFRRFIDNIDKFAPRLEVYYNDKVIKQYAAGPSKTFTEITTMHAISISGSNNNRLIVDQSLVPCTVYFTNNGVRPLGMGQSRITKNNSIWFNGIGGQLNQLNDNEMLYVIIKTDDGRNYGPYIFNSIVGDPLAMTKYGASIEPYVSVNYKVGTSVAITPSSTITIKSTTLVSKENQVPSPLPNEPIGTIYSKLTRIDGGEVIIKNTTDVIQIDPTVYQKLTIYHQVNLYPSANFANLYIRKRNVYFSTILNAYNEYETLESVFRNSINTVTKEIMVIPNLASSANNILKMNADMANNVEYYKGIKLQYETVVTDFKNGLDISEGDKYPLNPYSNFNYYNWYYIKYPTDYKIPDFSTVTNEPLNLLITPEDVPTPSTMSVINVSEDIKLLIEISNKYGTVLLDISDGPANNAVVNIANATSVFRVRSADGVFFDNKYPVILVTNSNGFDDVGYCLFLKPNSFGVLNIEIDMNRINNINFIAAPKQQMQRTPYVKAGVNTSVDMQMGFICNLNNFARKIELRATNSAATNLSQTVSPFPYSNADYQYMSFKGSGTGFACHELTYNGTDYQHVFLKLYGCNTGDRISLATGTAVIDLIGEVNFNGDFFYILDKTSVPDFLNKKVLGVNHNKVQIIIKPPGVKETITPDYAAFNSLTI